MVAERGHPARLIARAAHRRPERRTHEDRRRRDGEEKDDERGAVETARRDERKSERFRARRHVDAVVAVGHADPAIGQPPQDLAERECDHDEADAGGPQREGGEGRRGEERDRKRGENGEGVSVAGGEQVGRGVGRHAEQSGVAERHQPGVTHQYAQSQRKDRVEQDLARDVDVIDFFDRVGRGGERKDCDEAGDLCSADHRICPPNKPCGRSTSTSTIGRNSTK